MAVETGRGLGLNTGEVLGAESDGRQFAGWTPGMVTRFTVTADTIDRGMSGVEDRLHVGRTLRIVTEQARFVGLGGRHCSAG